MQSFRKTLEGPAGKVIAVAFVLIGGLAAYLSLRGGGPTAGDLSRQRVLIDSETNKSFNYELKAGENFPVKAPSGGKTGYPAEACYWTRDGQVKAEPTYVLLNQMLGKPGPTYCPDCGRLVVPRNPRPAEGDKPPPTEAERTASR
jgi:hypothetical protein